MKFWEMLRNLPRIAELTAMLAESGSARLHAEDEARLWRSKAETYEKQAIEAREEERRTHHALEDFLSQRITGNSIWNIAPQIPVQDMTLVPGMPRRRRTAREVQAEIEAEFNTEFDSLQNPQTETQQNRS